MPSWSVVSSLHWVEEYWSPLSWLLCRTYSKAIWKGYQIKPKGFSKACGSCGNSKKKAISEPLKSADNRMPTGRLWLRLQYDKIAAIKYFNASYFRICFSHAKFEKPSWAISADSFYINHRRGIKNAFYPGSCPNSFQCWTIQKNECQRVHFQGLLHCWSKQTWVNKSQHV